jgi:hypothetical protein
MHENSSTISSSLASIPLSSIRQMLPDKAILGACQEAGYQFRHRLIVPVITVLHMVLRFYGLLLRVVTHSCRFTVLHGGRSPKRAADYPWPSGTRCLGGFRNRPNSCPSRGRGGMGIGWCCPYRARVFGGCFPSALPWAKV